MLRDRSEIGVILQNAVVFNPRNWGSAMPVGCLMETVDRLFALLERRRIDYVLVGGVALLHYLKGRNTQDIDLILALEELSRTPEIKVEIQDDPYFARGSFESLQIDFFLAQNPVFCLVKDQYSVRRFLGDNEVRIATVEGLLILKLYALPSLYRQGDFSRVSIYENDIASLMYAYDFEARTLLKKLSDYLCGGEISELSQILSDIEQRIRRFKRKSQRHCPT